MFAVLFAGDRARAPGAGAHIAFVAPSRESVHAFHGEAYYAAFVRDLDGYRIEAVAHE